VLEQTMLGQPAQEAQARYYRLMLAVHEALRIFDGRPRCGRSSSVVSGRRSTWISSLFWSQSRPEQ
jgi:hypothetical protein